jgi:FdhD protein
VSNSQPKFETERRMMSPIFPVERQIWRSGGAAFGERAIAEETAVAFTYNGSSHAVMLATPQDLQDFAIGFSLTEGIIGSLADIETLEIVERDNGIELAMWLAEPRARILSERRRMLAGPTGCGLCGIESLDQAVRPTAKIVGHELFSRHDIMRGLEALRDEQPIYRQTRAVHGAAFYRPEQGLIAAREDVGRHNALDKLAGALARQRLTGAGGFGIVTSRVSIEMVQKAAIIGMPVLVAISAPTALAVRTAQAAGITLIAVARDDGFEVFTHAQRITEMQVPQAGAG